MSDTFQMPGTIGGGPFSIDTGHIVTNATADRASGRATTNVVGLAPIIQITSLDVVSESIRRLDHVEHMARTVVNGITIGVSEALKVSIGKLVAMAETSSDGASPAARASLKLSDVGVVMNGTEYRATIDETGIRITGFTEDAAVIPGFVPQDVNQALQVLLDQANVRIGTAQGTETVEDVAADASLSGLLITFTGTVPNVFIPNAVSELLYGTIVPQLPEALRKEFIEGSTCYKEDLKPRLPEQLTSNLPDLPVCFSAQLIPGPGSGTVTTLSLGTVRSLSAAVQSEAIAAPGTDGGIDGGLIPEPPLGGIVPPIDGGFPQDPGGNGGTVGRQPVLTGLVARLPSWALFGAGGALLLLAMGIAIGPSLRQWRAIQEP